MARNRKSDAAALRAGPVARVLVFCALISAAGVGYVWQKEQIGRLSTQIHQREDRLKELIDENENRKRLLANMRLPVFLERKIKELNLGLAPPALTQVWRLTEPSAEAARGGAEVPRPLEEGRGSSVRRTNEPPGQ